MTWNKGAHGVVAHIKAIERAAAHLPYAALIATTSQRSSITISCTISQAIKTAHLPRSRPYQNNANAPVDQNNWRHVRQLFGYDHFDNAQLIDLMNDGTPTSGFATTSLLYFQTEQF